MKAYVYFSVHEELFYRLAERLRDHGVDSFSGFVWGQHQLNFLFSREIRVDPLVVFTRDLLPLADDGQKPDLDWLQAQERELGISIQRMLAAERHLLKGRTFEQIMRLAEIGLKQIAAAYDRAQPDFVISDDTSCFHSYAHFAIARQRRIPFWCITSARLPYRISVYSSGQQRWERVEKLYPELLARGLGATERAAAEQYVDAFRNKPVRPSGMATRARKPGIDLSELGRLRLSATRYLNDRADPTVIPPWRAVGQRLTRMARVAAADATNVFEAPVPGEKYFFFPLHFQPEASTLVQAPLYVDQLALIRDITASMPVGYRLYVKEHLSSRGRRPLEYYNELRAIPNVRLLGPDADTWSLIRGATVVTVITGTVGWEALLFDKPVVTFGNVFFNLVPHVYRAGRLPKDDWYAMFQQAVTSHRVNPDAVLALVSAIQQCSHPGFIGNPSSFPEVLEPENVSNLAEALAREIGLGEPRTQARTAP